MEDKAMLESNLSANAGVYTGRSSTANKARAFSFFDIFDNKFLPGIPKSDKLFQELQDF